MNKYFAFGLGFVLIGGGCMTQSPIDVTEEAPVIPQGEAEAFPSGSWQFIETDTFLLPVDYEFSLERGETTYRIQNFVSTDNPHEVYPAEAFFIEISINQNDIASTIAGNYDDSFEAVGLSGELVTRYIGRHPGGESWPGHAYYNEERGVLINLYYTQDEGGELAESVIQNIEWGADARPELFD